MRVVVGLVFNDQGEVLLAERAHHKHQGGRWEFPGGKIERDETSFEALKRELKEECDITVTEASFWHTFRHVYPDKVVNLDVWRVSHYQGIPSGLEGQSIRWSAVSQLFSLPIPDANHEIVHILIKNK